jgi:DNA-directed RNA polymerase subunit M/transcription elongation factor TFIIS
MADLRELSGGEYAKEREALLSKAKKSVFELELRDWYWLKEEKELNDSYYKHLLAWKASGIGSIRAHVVTFPINEYITYESEYYKKLQEAGEKIFFLDRNRFDRIKQPSGIEICDFLAVDDVVLLTRYLPNQKMMNCEIESGCLIREKDIVKKYTALKNSILEASVAMDAFLESAGMVKLRITKHSCPKCDNEKAFLLFYGVVVGDEAPLIIYRCTRCGAVAREWK